MPRELVRLAPVAAAKIFAAAAFAAALCLGPCPSRAADSPPKSGADTAEKSVTSSPSAQVDVPSPAGQGDTAPADASRGKRHKPHIQITSDADFDPFDEAMQTAPWLVGVIFLSVLLFFITPIILVVGVIWYKLRKTRLQNEAMLALAEKGVLPTAQAAEAIATGLSPSQAMESFAPGGHPRDSAAPVYGQAVASRKRAVWSDLRKGVIMTMVGLALSFYSLTDDGTPNWLGLVLVFVGLGYIALWWLEGRDVTGASSNGSSGRGTG